MRVFLCVFLFLFHFNSFAFVGKSIGKGYCSITHPVESIFSSRAGCESQHIIQQNAGGEDYANTIWINTTQHSYLDRSSCKPWEKQRPSMFARWFADPNMERAYMSGVWAKGAHFFVYDHHGDGRWTALEWDGATHLLYGITSIINFPQKELNYFAYQIERFKKGQETQFIDAIIGLPIGLFEVALGVANSVIGIVVGTILNPLDTIRNLLPSITLGIASIYNSIALFIKGLIAIVTLGSYGSCGLN